MRSPYSLDRVDTASDGTQPVADAGLLLSATLAQHRASCRWSSGSPASAAGQANRGDKILTLVMSALARGDCSDV
jgi:hypothetical protein